MVPLLRALSVAGVLGVLVSVQGLPVAAQTDDGEKEQARLLKEARERAKKAEELTIALTAELKRLQTEVAQFQGLIKSRDETILKLTKENREMHERALAAELQARTALQRSQRTLKALQEKSIYIRKTVGPDNAANPPPAYVKGTILKIDPKDKTQVEISLGKDAGLKVGHTLEAYRLKPRPEYLGRLQILAVQEQRATARLQKSAVQHSDVKAGDEVASTISR